MGEDADEIEDDEEEEKAVKEPGDSPPGDKLVEGEPDASWEGLVAKHADVAGEEEESVIEFDRDEALEPLNIRVAPRQSNEFVCSNCHLVKRKGQLADAKRMLCRDCV